MKLTKQELSKRLNGKPKDGEDLYSRPRPKPVMEDSGKLPKRSYRQ